MSRFGLGLYLCKSSVPWPITCSKMIKLMSQHIWLKLDHQWKLRKFYALIFKWWNHAISSLNYETSFKIFLQYFQNFESTLFSCLYLDIFNIIQSSNKFEKGNFKVFGSWAGVDRMKLFFCQNQIFITRVEHVPNLDHWYWIFCNLCA